jgi:hypothetical protein
MLSASYRAERKPRGYAQLTVSTTALALPSIPKGAQYAIVYINAQPVRYRDDGTAPTASVGMPAVSGTTIELVSAESIRNFRAIRSGGTDAELNVSYYSANKAF